MLRLVCLKPRVKRQVSLRDLRAPGYALWGGRVHFLFLALASQVVSRKIGRQGMLLYSPLFWSQLRAALEYLRSVRQSLVFISSPRSSEHARLLAVNLLLGKANLIQSYLFFSDPQARVRSDFFFFFWGFRLSFLSFMGLSHIMGRSGGLVLPDQNKDRLKLCLPMVHSVSFSLSFFPPLVFRALL